MQSSLLKSIEEDVCVLDGIQYNIDIDKNSAAGPEHD